LGSISHPGNRPGLCSSEDLDQHGSLPIPPLARDSSKSCDTHWLRRVVDAFPVAVISLKLAQSRADEEEVWNISANALRAARLRQMTDVEHLRRIH
jgi:hypothetical protein